MAKQCWLSTSDNPFNPFEKNNHAWDDWSRWDEDHGYYTTNLLMRAAYISPELSDVQNDEEIERAVDSLVKNLIPFINSEGKEVYYIKVQEE